MLDINFENLLNAFIILLTSGVLVSCHKNGEEEITDKRTGIFIESGRIQCELDSGISLQDSINLLENSEIEHYDSGCAYQDFGVPTACGYETNQIYIHVIDDNKLSVAQDIGFKPLKYLKKEYHVGYRIAECWDDT